MFDKCLFVLRNLSSLLERLCALQSRVFDRFFEAAEIAKFTSREFGEHWENLGQRIFLVGKLSFKRIA